MLLAAEIGPNGWPEGPGARCDVGPSPCRAAPSGGPEATGARFGVLQKNGKASVLIRNEKIAGLWHFDGKRWIKDPKGLDGLLLDGPVLTSKNGLDQGVRLRDLDGDGTCELIVGNDRQNAVFA